MIEPKSPVGRMCRVCGTILTLENTYPSLNKVGNYICKSCHNNYCKKKSSPNPHAKLPYHSEIKLKKYEEFCAQSLRIEECIIINPDEPTMINGKGDYFDGMARITINAFPNANIIIVDRNEKTSKSWNNSNHKLLITSFENYLMTDFTPSKKKTLILFHSAGTIKDRRFYTYKIFNDIKIYRPNVIIIFVILDVWNYIARYPNTKKEWVVSLMNEDLFRRGFIEAKTHPTRSFYNWKDEIEKDLLSDMKIEVICRKETKGKWREFILAKME